MAEKSSNIRLKVTDNGYKAYISIMADKSTMRMTLPDLKELLKRHNIVFGTSRGVLDIIIGKLKKGTDIENIMVARGVEPFEGVAPEVEYKFELWDKPKETESGKIDYRELQKFFTVQKDQLLAVKRNFKPPINGKTVTGKETTFPPMEDIIIHAGANINAEESEDITEYKAACDGALKFEKNTLTVFPTLQIRQDVDFNVGNIHFKGDVKIGRDVLPDFVVEAAGKITIYGSAISCKVQAGEDIKIQAGIVGKNKGTVQTKGNVTATFVENATLEAGGNITVKNGIIGSTVRCNGFLKVDARRSRIVGSQLKASQGIEIHNVGSRFDTGMVMVTGINPQKEEEYGKIKRAMEARWNDAKELEKKYGRSALDNKNFTQPLSPEVQRDIEKWDILKTQIKTILNHLKKTEEEMYALNSTIRIKETLYPRVTLQIGTHKLTTDREYFDVTVRYSEELEKLVITAGSKPGAPKN